MSADNITICPECEQPELREYRDSFTVTKGGLTYGLVIAYRCECRSCGFSWSYENRRIVPTKRIGAL